MMLGASLAVHHYNFFARTLSELACRIFGIPILGYFDDFGPPSPCRVPFLKGGWGFPHLVPAIGNRPQSS